MNPQEGFTLVELSIVLVIIGLIVGGILTGQDLIAAAKIRSQVSQLTQYSTAVNTFHEKYAGLPGDLLSGANYFSGITNQNPAVSGEGNGDGAIQSSTAPGNMVGEVVLFWYELNQAGLIPDDTIGSGGDYSNNVNLNVDSTIVPNGRIAGVQIFVDSGYYVTSLASNNYWILYNLSGGTSNKALTVLQASGIDSKIDDGVANTGNVVSTRFWYEPGTVGDVGHTGGGNSAGCTTDVTHATYNLTYPNNINCMISILASF